MADYSTITIDGETRNIKDATSRNKITKVESELYYKCSNRVTSAGTGLISNCYKEVLNELMATSFAVGEPVFFTLLVDGVSRYTGEFVRTRSGETGGCTATVHTEKGNRYGLGVVGSDYYITTFADSNQLSHYVGNITTESGTGGLEDTYKTILQSLLATNYPIGAAIMFTVNINTVSIFTGYFCKTSSTNATAWVNSEGGWHYDFGVRNGTYSFHRSADYNQSSYDLGNIVTSDSTGNPNSAYKEIINKLLATGYGVGRTVEFVCTIDTYGRYSGRFTKTLSNDDSVGCVMTLFTEKGSVLSYGYLNGTYYTSDEFNDGRLASRGELRREARTTCSHVSSGATNKLIDATKVNKDISYEIRFITSDKTLRKHLILIKTTDNSYVFCDVITDDEIVVSVNEITSGLHDVVVKNNKSIPIYCVITPVVNNY